jgi:DUF971 family protein
MENSDMAALTVTPQSLTSDGQALLITWSDGATHRIPWLFLRERCPCAVCKAKEHEPPPQSGLLPVLSAAEAQPLKVLGMKPVGNYAYAIHFSDGHTSGIYAVEYLRELGEEFAKRSGE